MAPPVILEDATYFGGRHAVYLAPARRRLREAVRPVSNGPGMPRASRSANGGNMRNKPCLTSADVKNMLAACVAEAEKNKWAVCVAIVDDGGSLLGFERMDGVGPISAEVSMGKARTSALTKRPSKFFEDRVKERPAFAGFPA